MCALFYDLQDIIDLLYMGMPIIAPLIDLTKKDLTFY
jgi:hypothetical protein